MARTHCECYAVGSSGEHKLYSTGLSQIASNSAPCITLLDLCVYALYVVYIALKFKIRRHIQTSTFLMSIVCSGEDALFIVTVTS